MNMNKIIQKNFTEIIKEFNNQGINFDKYLDRKVEKIIFEGRETPNHYILFICGDDNGNFDETIKISKKLGDKTFFNNSKVNQRIINEVLEV
ncbi:MAG: hypothetical protein ACOCP4_02945 [Candidatus Woesearchaeota archaeon]